MVSMNAEEPCTLDQVREWMDPIPCEGCTGEWSKRTNGQWVYTVMRTSDGAKRAYHLEFMH